MEKGDKVLNIILLKWEPIDSIPLPDCIGSDIDYTPEEMLYIAVIRREVPLLSFEDKVEPEGVYRIREHDFEIIIERLENETTRSLQ